jgi:cystathionine beta-synthase
MAMAGALDWLRAHRDTLTPDHVVVVILPDSGFRYLRKTYNDDWMRNHGFLESKADLTVEEVLTARPQQRRVVAVAPTDTLGEAILRMSENSISQLPVIEQDEVIGSLTETVILNRLIEQPDARNEAVRAVMSEPFPIVPRSIHLDSLSAYLEQGSGAVLVEPGAGGGYQIITKSDLISALAGAGRSGSGFTATT